MEANGQFDAPTSSPTGYEEAGLGTVWTLILGRLTCSPVAVLSQTGSSSVSIMTGGLINSWGMPFAFLQWTEIANYWHAQNLSFYQHVIFGRHMLIPHVVLSIVNHFVLKYSGVCLTFHIYKCIREFFDVLYGERKVGVRSWPVLLGTVKLYWRMLLK
jgi:hypothetical protein